jgi:hypothetical protein
VRLQFPCIFSFLHSFHYNPFTHFLWQCIVAVFGNEKEMFSDKLMPILERFCRDPDEEVRSTVASGFHEILAHRKNCPAVSAPPQKTPTASTTTPAAAGTSAAAAEQPQLLNPFVELLSSGSGEVVQHLTGNLQKILPILYKEIASSGHNNKKTVRKKEKNKCIYFTLLTSFSAIHFDKIESNFVELQFPVALFRLLAFP